MKEQGGEMTKILVQRESGPMGGLSRRNRGGAVKIKYRFRKG